MKKKGQCNENKLFMTELGGVIGAQILDLLDDQAVHHSFTKEDKFQQILQKDHMEVSHLMDVFLLISFKE